MKAELYDQHLTQIPVHQVNENSTFSLFNEGGDFLLSEEGFLVNYGLGRNYGLELTLERFFHRSYYLLFTNSLFRSRYRAGNGQWYNSKFDAAYIFNILAGKEWTVFKNDKILLDVKTTYAGGRRYTSIDLESSQQQGQTIFFDYFYNITFTKILRRIIPNIKPNGELVIGNFHSINPTRSEMEVTDGSLYHRTKIELIELAQKAGIVETERISVEQESEGINLFLRVQF